MIVISEPWMRKLSPKVLSHLLSVLGIIYMIEMAVTLLCRLSLLCLVLWSHIGGLDRGVSGLFRHLLS